MALQTDLNIAPYFDDYDETKNFHMINFKPSNQVGGRELSQLQRILQTQIERFGETVLERGSIVSGGNFYDYTNISYIKILDNNEKNQPIVLRNYVGARLVGRNTGVEAVVLTTADGFVSKSPDLNTLYVKYIKSGIDANDLNVKTFLPGEILEGYVGDVRTDDLDIRVASYNVDVNPLGTGYAVSCGDGVLFQKGYFVKFSNQIVVVSKYDSVPHEMCVGFKTEEFLVNSNGDTTLKDNAIGSKNYRAPGADRLQLNPVLIAIPKSETENNLDFMPIQEYENGLILVKRTGTTFSENLYNNFQKRTYEESGNYTISGHQITVEKSPRSDEPVVAVSDGVSYVNGKRVETFAKKYLTIDSTVESGVSSDVLSIEYGPYVNVTTAVGNVHTNGTTTNVSLMSSAQTVRTTTAGTIIGTAKVISYSQDLVSKVYLTNIVMNANQKFDDVKSVKNGTTGFSNIVLETNGKAKLYNSNKKSMMATILTEGVLGANAQNIVYTKTDVLANTVANTINITLPAGQSFNLPDGTYTTPTYLNKFGMYRGNNSYNPVSVTISASSKTAAISTGLPNASTNIFYEVVSENPQRIEKTSNFFYVRIDPNAMDKTKPIYLGFSDVQAIQGIWAGSNNTFTEASSGIRNVTNNFTLNKNVDGFSYMTSFIKLKPNYTLSNSDKLLIKVRVFTRSNGVYSSIDSYPIDDISTVLPNDKIRSKNLEYEKKNSIDFKIYYTNTSTAATTPATATIITNATNIPSANVANNGVGLGATPVSGSQFTVNYTHNLPRIDNVVIDSKGNMKIISGVPSTNPKATSINDTRNMSLGTIFVPPPPRLLISEAIKIGSPDKGIIVSTNRNKSYTMKAIGDIDERVSNIEYYTVLSAQELSADNMVIKGADGLDRFKNGIFVENFKNMAACDTRNEDFGASVDSSVLYPRFKSYNLTLGVNSANSNIILDGNTANLKYNEIIHEQQIVSTRYRNCVTDFYNYNGNGFLSPEYDFGYDETIAPDVTIDINLEEAFADYSAALSEFVPLQTSVSNSTSITTQLSSSVNTSVSPVGRTTTVISNTFNTTTTTVTDTEELVQSGSETQSQKVGDFVKNIQFSPFMRANVVRAAFTGMRPNTRFWFWFDNVAISDRCAPALMDNDDVGSMKRSGEWGAIIRSNSNGELFFMFNLPKDTFYVGERTLLVMDVDSTAGADAATSVASANYNGFNYSVEKGGFEISTRTPTFAVEKNRSVSVSSNTFTVSTTIVSVRRQSGRSSDPLAQTFVISPSMSNKEAIMITKVAIPFKKKSATLGVTAEIRKVENGFPAKTILPFAKKRLSTNMVKLSDDGSVYTEFKFDSPVSLTVGESYAIVVIPDSNNPDYFVFTNKTGEVDLITGKSVTSDTSSGTLFTSTNNSAWTPYQDENMSYKLYRADYTAKTGEMELVVKNYEFFDIEGMTGTFTRGETVFKINPYETGTVSTSINSRTIVSNGVNLKNIFKVGDYIAIYNQINNTYNVSRINTIVNDTTISLDEYMTTTLTNRNFFKTVVGTCDYIDKNKNPVRLFLKDSTASSNNYFTDGNAVRGETSNAIASVSEIISLPISAWQANIYRNSYTDTSVSMSLSRQTTSDGSTIASNLVQKFGENNRLLNYDSIIKSRSKELVEDGGAKSFAIKLQLNIGGSAPYTVSPSVDYAISGVTVYEYLIEPYDNETITTEKFNGGLSLSKYISKPITLRDGFDAEDLKIWLTAYKPLNSEITVFAKFISSIDETPENEIPWTKMVSTDSSNFKSSSTNIEDYKEFEYGIPTTNPGNNGGAYISGGDFRYADENGGTHHNYKKYILKIVFSSTGQNRIPKVKDIRAISLT